MQALDSAQVGTKLPPGKHKIAAMGIELENELRPTAATIAKNLAMLLKKSGLEAQQVAIRAGIGIRTMSNLQAGSNPTIETVEAVANIFGLTCWHLLNPDLERDLANQDWLDRIHRLFNVAPQQGVDLLKKAVEMAEVLTPPKQKTR